MQEIRIIHLFPRLLSLYGEYGNVAILCRQLETMGCQVSVTHYEGGALELQEQDMVYIGSGTEDNLLQALKKLMPYREAIVQSIARGTLWLATGNAMALFGKTLQRGEHTLEALNVEAYASRIDDSKRFLGDVLSDSGFAGHPTLGFVNTSCLYQGITQPWLQLQLGAQLGNDKTSGADGIHSGSFHATQLIGPLLTKNPHILGHFVRLLTGQDMVHDPDSYLEKAYALSVRELSKRINP